ncbi:MAG TPA: PAS domain S-box protein [Candidatus Polarisedimenticolia bacterium]|nr:PAS domain S-box protein [Candidatus Polarisedimenticolia bacterium]
MSSAPRPAEPAPPAGRECEEHERRIRLLEAQMRLLERERQKLAAVVNYTDAGFLVFDAARRVVWANPTFARRFSDAAHPGAVIGRECHRVICGREAPCETCPAAQPFRTRNVAHHETPVTIDGRARHLYITGMPITSPSGEIDQTIVMLQDLTDLEVLRRSREALSTSEERFRSIFEKAGAGMATVALDGSFLQVNAALGRFLGYDEADLLKMKVHDVVHPEDLEATRRVFAGGLNEVPEIVDVERRYIRRDGALFWGRTTVTWIFDVQRRPAYSVALVLDISERKQAEEALRKSEEQLQQSQKMEAVGRLAGGVAHDFNNLLTVITGRGQMVLDRLPPGDPTRAEIEVILSAGERAASLTRQLLAFSRRQVLQPQVLDLNAVVADMDKMLRRLIGEDIDLVTVLKPEIGNVKADPGQVSQVLMNLAVNARDAMPEGGKLTIETAEVEFDEAYERSHAPAKAGRYIMLALSDTGVGMSLETQSHIFEPFFTTKGLGRGTGLGLSTVYGIVKQSGGYIWVYSEPGRGSTFKIYLPRVDQAARTADSARSEPRALRGTETVLLVEDEEVVRELVREVLRHYGYEVLEALDVAEARRLCAEHRGTIHLMVTDVVMPVMGGPELAQILGGERPGMKILYMSGYTDDAIVHHGVLDEDVPFLQKPFTPDALARRVREVLDGR